MVQIENIRHSEPFCDGLSGFPPKNTQLWEASGGETGNPKIITYKNNPLQGVQSQRTTESALIETDSFTE
ncbi:MAG: hypothetical protein HQK84_05905 [Nitrospinae bacterium]|nr:hypothetical protein [Nitrospinota bacterium]